RPRSRVLSFRPLRNRRNGTKPTSSRSISRHPKTRTLPRRTFGFFGAFRPAISRPRSHPNRPFVRTHAALPTRPPHDLSTDPRRPPPAIASVKSASPRPAPERPPVATAITTRSRRSPITPVVDSDSSLADHVGPVATHVGGTRDGNGGELGRRRRQLA